MARRSKKPVVKAKTPVTAPCPFCRGTYSLGYEAEHPGTKKDTPVVLHSLPPCKRFNEEEDALTFAVAARKAREAS